MRREVGHSSSSAARGESGTRVRPLDPAGSPWPPVPTSDSPPYEVRVRHPVKDGWAECDRGQRSRAVETHRHFSRIARKYKDLRSTDLPPIKFIRDRLRNCKEVLAADVGCGAGRYDVELVRHLGTGRLLLICIDSNERMLAQLAANVRNQGFDSFKTIQAGASTLPLPPDSLDAIFTFNAVHHFRLPEFLRQSALTLRDGGNLFIYTRFRSQNKRNIWGRLFPGFNEKESRLYELSDIQEALQEIPELWLGSVDYFKYRRSAPLDWLETQAVNRHYSTFSLYKNREFEQALEGFRANIARQFHDVNNVTWNDQNVMLVVKKSRK